MKTKQILLALTLSGITTCFPILNNLNAAENGSARNEQFRPQVHYSPAVNWTNDPNGMFYLNGTYHLYYQHNPNGNKWGPMHWGHASTKDLVHWEDHPIALYPDDLGTIFSGSAVVDTLNTAGFGVNAVVAIFTSAGKVQAQSIAYSTDGGTTFTKYEGNPVIKNPGVADFRDPKVIWYPKENKWVMALATGATISFFESKNLKEWNKTSEFGKDIGSHTGVWECPDLFPLPLKGQEKWVLFVSNGGVPNGGTATQYFVGTFDGKTFTADPAPYPLWIDYGKDNYASVSWSNVPGNRRMIMGWMSNWDYANDVPTEIWRNGFTLPRELSLISHRDGHALLQFSVPDEVEHYFKRETRDVKKTIKYNSTREFSARNQGNPWKADIEFEHANNSELLLTLSNKFGEKLDITLNIRDEKAIINRTESGLCNFSDRFTAQQSESPLYTNDDDLTISIYVDTSSVEIFVEDGVAPQTTLVFPKTIYSELSIKNLTEPKIQADVEISVAKSIWK